MDSTVRQFCEMLLEAAPNDRYYFAMETRTGMPYTFRVQKVQIIDIRDMDLFVITDDEASRERIFNLCKYKRGFCSGDRVNAIGHILYEYLAWYNDEVTNAPPFPFFRDEVKKTVIPEEDDAPKFLQFMALKCLDIERF